jgi:hypothetical protein|nr:MAG TPA: bifunctional HTH-domain containing protein/aminotransferase [Caudoviricetes sp.]
MKTNTSTRLKLIMKMRNLKQIDILDRCKNNPYDIKISKSDLSQYVSGKVLPRQDKLSILAYALDVSEAWLMGYDVPMEVTSDNTDFDIIKQDLISNIMLMFNSFDADKLIYFNELISQAKNFNNDDLNSLKKYVLFLKSQTND